MPTPVPTPTATQYVTVADIVMEDVSDVITAIAADSDQDISNAQWALTLSDITTWNTAFEFGKRQVKRVGNIEFYQTAVVDTRLDLRNRVRTRYGFEELITEGETLTSVSSLQWF